MTNEYYIMCICVSIIITFVKRNRVKFNTIQTDRNNMLFGLFLPRYFQIDANFYIIYVFIFRQYGYKYNQYNKIIMLHLIATYNFVGYFYRKFFFFFNISYYLIFYLCFKCFHIIIFFLYRIKQIHNNIGSYIFCKNKFLFVIL